jgi:hypothetical protein
METALRVMSPPGLLNLSLFRDNWLPHPADSISAQGKYIFVSLVTRRRYEKIYVI